MPKTPCKVCYKTSCYHCLTCSKDMSREDHAEECEFNEKANVCKACEGSGINSGGRYHCFSCNGTGVQSKGKLT